MSQRTITADPESTITADSQRTITADLESTITADSRLNSREIESQNNFQENQLNLPIHVEPIHPHLEDLHFVIEYDDDVVQPEIVDDGFFNVDMRPVNELDYPVGLRTYNENRIVQNYLGRMIGSCQNCNALFFNQERLNSHNRYKKCCKEGSVNLALLQDPPQPLLDLYNYEHPHSRIFFQEIRALNSVFSFTSMGVKLDARLANAAAGGYTFRIHDAIYHRIGPLLPEANRPAQFAQIFFYDSANSVSRRREIFNQLPEQLLMILTDCFNDHNHLLHQFRQVGQQVLRRNDGLQMRFLSNLSGLDRSRYSAPTAEHEVAAIVPSDNPEGAERSILVSTTNPGPNNLQLIPETHFLLDPLSYIMIFPRGEFGWNYEMRLNNSDRHLTLLDFARHRVHVRRGNFNTILRAGRLFQQYVVDIYVRIEKIRLDYLRHNQAQLRAELYQGLADAHRLAIEENYGNVDTNQVGRFCVLPSSFVGGPRFMTQIYQDAMAIVRKFGKPDLFITMTCNPHWLEIQEQLLTGQTSWDRPDLVNRVFKIKLDRLLHFIENEEVLGTVVAIIYTIEFQKRGLPHCHMLIILNQASKLRTIEKIDKCVSAELPDPTTQPRLFQIVSNMMIHRPCENNPDAVCKINNRCSKNFPKPFTERTMIDQGTYPKYKRSRSGPRILVRNQEIGNEYVVPYNKYLTDTFNCHINVEICSSLQAIKYLYKYVYKGHDLAAVEIRPEDRFNEINKYVAGRYISASEAIWRIFSFNLHKESPNVYRLPIHLENHQNVIFRAGDEVERILNRNQRTKFTAWFEANLAYPEGRRYLYAEYPEFYAFDERSKTWHQRVRERTYPTVGRIYNVSPREGERFYLRMMLNHIRGATSFQELRTVNGLIYRTYREAAIALGILTSDDEWINMLQDAILIQRPELCRELFAYILVFCNVHNATHLWENFRQGLSEDIIYRYRNNADVREEDCYDVALIRIEEILILHGRRLDQFGLPEPNRNLQLVQDNRSSILEEELGMDTEMDRRTFEQMLNNLTEDQRTIFNRIMQTVNHERHRQNRNLFFLNAPGGTGKTYLLNTLLAAVRTEQDQLTGRSGIALAVASSGIAALLLKNGRTAHSRFKIPLNVSSTSTCNIHLQSELANLIRCAKLIVWDEAVMTHKFIFQCVDKTLRTIMNSTEKFGGKVVVFGGDFRQILPVVPLGGKIEIIEACFKNSYLWSDIQNLYLRENLRVRRGDPQYANYTRFLDRIGNGGNIAQFGNLAHIDDTGESVVTIPAMIMTNSTDLDSFIQEIYPELNGNDLQRYANTAILAPTNNNVDAINQRILELFNPDEEQHTYLSADQISDEESEENRLNITVEFLNSISLSGLPPHKLNLKIGSIVILLRNLNPKRGLCNGTRLMIESLRNNFIIARILIGQFANQTVLIPKITLTSTTQDRFPFIIQRHQIPVKLAFAMTINKAQGQTLERVGIYLEDPVFTHGQLYVALSRATDVNSIRVYLSENTMGILAQTQTKNVVYREVLF